MTDQRTPSPEGAEQPGDAAEEPDTAELEEPSTEKEPGEEPTAPESAEPAPRDPGADHHAVGIGVIDGPLVDPQAEN